MEDDLSLAFLNIPRDKSSKWFNCEAIKQTQLTNKTFYVVDFKDKVETRYSKEKGTEGQYLVFIKFNLNDSESDARKFFTGSRDIKYILNEIAKRDAFPRRVTMRCIGNKFFFE